MADNLAAASVILAVLAMAYSTWYGEFCAARDKRIPTQPEERKAAAQEVDPVYARARLVCIGAWVTFGVFAIDAVGIALTSIRAVADDGCAAICRYDSSRAALVVVALFQFALATDVTRMALAILRRRCELLPRSANVTG